MLLQGLVYTHVLTLRLVRIPTAPSPAASPEWFYLLLIGGSSRCLEAHLHMQALIRDRRLEVFTWQSLEFSLCAEPLHGIPPCDVELPWPPRTLDSVPTPRDPQPSWGSFQAVSWCSDRTQLASPLSEITVLPRLQCWKLGFPPPWFF